MQPDERKNLDGHAIWVTRPIEQTAELASRIADCGLVPMVAPLIEIDLSPGENLSDALHRLDDYEVVVVTSANAVRAVAAALPPDGLGVAATATPKWIAVGPATAAAARTLGFTAEAPAGVRTAADLVDELATARPDNRRLLYLRGALADREVGQRLRTVGYQVDEVVCYETHPAPWPADVWQRFLATPAPRAVLLFSPSAARVFAANVGDLRAEAPGTLVGCVGKTTAAACASLGVPVHAVADRPQSNALLSAAMSAMQRFSDGEET